MTEASVAKRIRRHVSGRLRPYFIVTSPGLESLCFRELMALPLTEKDARIVKGGVEFNGRLVDCWVANLCLRTATRILMRLVEFSATNFRQLTRYASEAPWELFLFSGSSVTVRVTSKHSRLYHSEAVRECLEAAVQKRLEQSGLTNQENEGCLPHPSQTLFVRIADDRFTLSMDSSGEHLYKRGIKIHGGIAPIRETLAAAVLMLGGYTGREPLVDPMCGSGTFSIEAALIARQIPAGWYREFAFMKWPSFNPKRWAFLKCEARRRGMPHNDAMIFASDTDAAAVDALQKTLSEYEFRHGIHTACRDFFDIDPLKFTDTPGLVVMNPPYGIRIGTPHFRDHLIADICRKLQKDFRGWKFAFITPEPFPAPACPLTHSAVPLYHGGLKLALITGKIPSVT